MLSAGVLLMALREPIRLAWTLEEVCDFASRWSIDLALALGLQRLAGHLPFGIRMISGWRTAEQQADLIRSGPGAPDHLSTHRSCPATGADLAVDGVDVGTAVKLRLGQEAVMVGLRWGGGSQPGADGTHGHEWNHVDLGPRR